MQKYLAFALLIAIGLSAGFLGEVDRDKGPENVIYISIDALSAEHLQCYGYSRRTAPNICGMENATLYTDAYATSVWTPVSIASMQRGVYAHRANLVGRETPLNSSFRSTADILNSKGYTTVLRSNHANVNRKMNMDKGFDEVEIFSSDSEMSEAAKSFEERLEHDKTYFRMHLVGAHDPYDPSRSHYNYSDYRFITEYNGTVSVMPRRHKQRTRRNQTYGITLDERERVVNHYDENIRAVDSYVGKYLEKLRESGEYEDSLIVITSDHGESFNSYGEGVWLHEQPNPAVARVPLLIKYPGADESERSSNFTSHMDPFKVIVNEVGAELGYSPDAVDPRYDSRGRHYTYVKGSKYAVANKTHFLWSRDGGFKAFREEDGGFKETNSDLNLLKRDLRVFRQKVERGDYERSVDVEKSEAIKEGLKELGYLR